MPAQEAVAACISRIDWHVVYHDRPLSQHWVFKYLKPGFRHVELFQPIPYGPGINDVGWLLFVPTAETLQMDIDADPRPPQVRFPGSVVQKVTVLQSIGRIRSRFDLGPSSCIEAVKWALGIRAWSVRTPWQLHRYIARRGGILTSGRPLKRRPTTHGVKV